MDIGITTGVIESERYHKGVANYVKYLVNNLSKYTKEHKYHLVHSFENPDPIYDIGNEILIPPYPFIQPELSAFLSNAIRSRNLLKDLDIIHITAPRLTQLPLATVPDTKKILTVHAMDLYIPPQLRARFHEEPKVWIQQKMFNHFFRRIEDRIDAYITVSHFLKEEIEQNLGISEEKIFPIHLAAGDKFRRKEFEKPFDFILSDTPTPDLIKIFYNLKKKGLQHKLVIFSMRGFGYKKAEKMVRKLGLQKSCYFKGYVPDDDLLRLYNTADVYVRLAGYEGFGIPPLEAMACGCPVVSTNVGSLPEVIGDAGILLDFTDVDGFVKAVYELLMDEGLRKEKIKRGLKRAKMFSWKKTAKETIRVYEEI